jgi:hypothetical protein
MFLFRSFFLWLYSPIGYLAASMKVSVSLQLLDLGQSVGLLGRVISSSQGLSCTQTQKYAHATKTLNIHTLSGIRTHGPGLRASEYSSCLKKNITSEEFYKIRMHYYRMFPGFPWSFCSSECILGTTVLNKVKFWSMYIISASRVQESDCIFCFSAL